MKALYKLTTLGLVMIFIIILGSCNTKPDRFKDVDWDEVMESYIVMTTSKQEVSLWLGGNTPIKIFWGDEGVTRDIIDTAQYDWAVDTFQKGSLQFSIEYKHNFRNQGPNIIVVYGNIIRFGGSSNYFTCIKITNLSFLEVLALSDNKLTTIDLSENHEIVYLGLSTNQLTSVDLSQQIQLRDLRLFDNFITNLDLTSNHSLEYISVEKNKFSTYELNNLFYSLHDKEHQATVNRPWKGIFFATNPGTDESDINIAIDKGWRVHGNNTIIEN